jgi:hypothetical protein
MDTRLRITASIAVAAASLIASAAGAGPAGNDYGSGAGHPVRYAPPGPCGYGRVQKLACEVHNHPPAKPIKTCKKVCVPG